MARRRASNHTAAGAEERVDHHPVKMMEKARPPTRHKLCASEHGWA